MKTPWTNEEDQGRKAKQLDINSNSSDAQRTRLLAALHHRSVSTPYARRDLDIMSPAARVFELRKAGWPIDTIWVIEQTDQGKPHRVALYVLGGR